MKAIAYLIIAALVATSVSAIDHIGAYTAYHPSTYSYGGYGGYGYGGYGGYYTAVRSPVQISWGCPAPWATSVRPWSNNPYAGLAVNQHYR